MFDILFFISSTQQFINSSVYPLSNFNHIRHIRTYKIFVQIILNIQNIKSAFNTNVEISRRLTSSVCKALSKRQPHNALSSYYSLSLIKFEAYKEILKFIFSKSKIVNRCSIFYSSFHQLNNSSIHQFIPYPTLTI